MAEVAVIGAGIVGLSTAVAIQQKVPKVKVTIIADKFGRDTTSNGAGGIFVPKVIGDVKESISHRWSKDSTDHFFRLAFSSEGETCGVSSVTGFEVLNTDTFPDWLKFMPMCEKMPPFFMQQFRPYYKYGYMYTTVTIESPKYLPWLMKKFLANGGTVKEQTIKGFQELCDKYDVVVNCTGLRSTSLTPDPALQPLRGHVVRVKAPWIKHFVHTDDDRYIIPVSETVAIGGVKQFGRDDMAPVAEESSKIFNDMLARFPALQGAQILYDWVGLRPHRECVRVETEVLQYGDKQMKVVHNYGHGAVGLSLSWGTAVYAAQLVSDVVNTRPRL